MLLVFLACVPPDPPTRSMLDVPRAPTPGPFRSEAEVFRLVADTLADAGFPHVEDVRLSLDEQAIFPFAGGTEVYARPFLVTPADARAHVAEVGVGLWGAPLELPAWTDEDLYAAYLVFHVAGLGHELVHGAAVAANSRDRDSYFVEEHRARDVEWPLLNRLAERQRIPAAWLGVYPRFLRAVADAMPAGAPVPADPDASRALFERGYEAASNRSHDHDPEAIAAVRMAVRYSAERTEAPAVPLESLASSLDPWPDPLGRAAAGAYQDLGLSPVDDGWAGSWRDTGVPVTARVDEASRTVVTSATLRMPAPKAAERAPILELLNVANAAGDATFSLGPDGIGVVVFPVPAASEADLRNAVETPVALVRALAAELPAVRAGKTTPADAWARVEARP